MRQNKILYENKFLSHVLIVMKEKVSMRILVLTLMMSFLIHSAFGVEQEKYN